MKNVARPKTHGASAQYTGGLLNAKAVSPQIAATQRADMADFMCFGVPRQLSHAYRTKVVTRQNDQPKIDAWRPLGQLA